MFDRKIIIFPRWFLLFSQKDYKHVGWCCFGVRAGVVKLCKKTVVYHQLGVSGAAISGGGGGGFVEDQH